jgi:hypothetical protein
MTHMPICRVWYGKRWGFLQSFTDIRNFYGAANFATLVVADRIEVISARRDRQLRSFVRGRNEIESGN